MKQRYRKLITKRGIYFVFWRPEDVIQLLINEILVPADFLCNEYRETRNMLRDFFLLACTDSLNIRQIDVSLLTQFARKLHASLYAIR